MARRRTADATHLMVPVAADAAEPLYRQVYEGLRAAILDGRLPAGGRLPSTRVLAGDLCVGRNTVTAAFEQLRAEGYVSARRGGGTRVRAVLPERLLRVRPRLPAVTGPVPSPAALSGRGTRISAAARWFPATVQPVRAFSVGVPALAEFPVRLWARLFARRCRRPPTLGMSDPAGYEPLRREIAAYVAASRGVRCSWEQVVVVGGSQHGLQLCARLLLDPGDGAWLEDPGYPGVRAVLEAEGAQVIPVPVDTEGLRVDEGRRRAGAARLAYVTPSHQFPLGSVMSVRRRLELLEWAHSAGAWLIEDDYDSEFRYTARPLPSLQGLDTRGRVLYLGTFSKTLFPALRLGYLVLPEGLVDAFAAARSIGDRHPPVLEQAVVADFMHTGDFTRHVRRMRTLYGERQQALLEVAGRELKGRVEIAQDGAGMHLVAWLSAGGDDRAVAARAAERGVTVDAVASYTIAARVRPGLLLGYAAVPEAAMAEGCRRLAQALSSRPLD